MKFILSFLILIFSSITGIHSAAAAGLEDRVITLKSNERFDLVQANSVTFKFQSLSDEARKLEITQDATALGVAYLGQLKLKENITALSALRSIADQIGESLDINFGVVADSNTSEALKANELLLLYHPNVTITLALAKPNEINDYEIICTYALKQLADKATTKAANTSAAPPSNISQQMTPASEPNIDFTPVEDVPESSSN
jgi:hypothetical protein